ncbi:hypothetical protein PPTG_21744 [Phytophthora nicotianae INRA-310]|uniref:Uncharacterized protein n=1 Tax=Phytophthora nicotianae (strain INRA-310) TaxID=761204 RepID=W2QWB7_PHYN3|nr:hypothetical protein PPTG_21744 [Phytophthora nicotianae INRA-310]ETN16565.1 hypothetical protein PPTG_21744 [Phytophthora nicotianae INRA-310]
MAICPGRKKFKTNTGRSDMTMALQQELKRRASASATKFITARVAFSPAYEPWMDGHLCRNADATFLIGIVSSYRIVNEVNGDSVSVPVPMFKIRWTSTAAGLP